MFKLYEVKCMLLLRFLFIALFIIIWCCEDANPLHDPKADIDIGKTYVDTLFATQDTFIVKGKINTGESPKLLIGSYQDFSTRFLIKFTNPGSDSGETVSAKVEFNSSSDFGPVSGSIDCDVYQVLEAWVENVNEFSSWTAYMEKINPSAVASFNISPSDSVYQFELPVTLIDQWQDTSTTSNYGLLIDFSSANYIKEISSSEGINSPRLIIEKIFPNDSTAIDTISSGIMDASLIEYDGTLFDQDNNNFFISAGYAVHSFIKFDFDLIPDNAMISSVNFVLSKDKENSIINENRKTEIIVRNVTSSYDSLHFGVYEIDSSFVNTPSHYLYLDEEVNNNIYMSDDIQLNNSNRVISRILNNVIIICRIIIKNNLRNC